jgi:methanogenic corrinoid protein MtbC1
MFMGENREIYEALVNLEEDKVKKLVRDNLDAGVSADKIMNQLKDALTEIGDRYEREQRWF